MANTLVIRSKTYLIQRVYEGIPTSKLVDTRVFRNQTGRGVEVGTTLISSGYLRRVLDEEGEIGSRVGI